MTAPSQEIIQVEYQNPQASGTLFLPITVISNTPVEELAKQVRINAARELPWVGAIVEHDRPAILVGGGPSAADHIEQIAGLQADGGVIYALNGASAWLRSQGIQADYQIIADAKENTATLVDPDAKAHLLASQCHPKTVDSVAARSTTLLWHHGLDAIEALFPPERVTKGDYVLLGGGAAVGNSSLCLAYALGHRVLHLFGFDSCHRGDLSHAYAQPMNDEIPFVDVKWAGKTYRCSVAMKWQAERFQVVAKYLTELGCRLELYGDGLLQAMYLTPVSDLSEKDKYVLMWQMDSYRDFSPGEHLVDHFLQILRPEGLIIDFGCGTGRAGLALAAKGHNVLLTDFADNCRDAEAQAIPFLQWDLTRPIPASAPYGYCTDVLEHIPPGDVRSVVENIMNAAGTVFFQISTVPDQFGQVIGTPLHLTVEPHGWWHDLFEALGHRVIYDMNRGSASIFIVSRKKS